MVYFFFNLNHSYFLGIYWRYIYFNGDFNFWKKGFTAVQRDNPLTLVWNTDFQWIWTFPVKRHYSGYWRCQSFPKLFLTNVKRYSLRGTVVNLIVEFFFKVKPWWKLWAMIVWLNLQNWCTPYFKKKTTWGFHFRLFIEKCVLKN